MQKKSNLLALSIITVISLMLWSYCFYIVYRVGVYGHGQSPSPSPVTTNHVHQYEEEGREMKSEDLDFVGKDHWSSDYMATCDQKKFKVHDDPDLFCTRYVMDYTWVNVEVISDDPILLVFPKFYPEKDVLAFRDYIHRKELDALQVVDPNDPSGSAGHTSRRANGTFIEHYESEITTKMFEFAQRRLPSLGLHGSEQWHALSYQPGGHYAPHFDYLDYQSESQWDFWMREHGNRLATFLAILQTADRGGGTIFPALSYVVHPGVGDAILWINMDVGGEKAVKSLHGACPILEGQKMAATLWIRRRASELSFLTDPDEERYDLYQLIDPYELPPIPSRRPRE